MEHLNDVRFVDRCLVEYGEEFPEPGQTMQAALPNYGLCKIYISKVGKPTWEDPQTVAVEAEYYIQEVIEPNNKYKLRTSGLSLVK